MIRIGAFVLNAADTARAARFWSTALDLDAEDNPDFLRTRTDSPTRLHLDDRDRTHLDLWVDSAEEQHAEVDRLLRLGARRVDWDHPADADFVVLADPEGNLFCVVNTAH